MAIRSWKLGYSLNKLGYEVSYAYEVYDFNFSYVDLETDFVKEYYKINNYFYLKCVMHKFDYVVIINGWRELGSIVASNNLNCIFYVGDLQILRNKFIKDGLNNISVIREKMVFNSNNKFIFTNQYMVNKLIKNYDQKFKRDYIVIPNSHLESKKNSRHIIDNLKIDYKDYTGKKKFHLVYIGSICDKQKSHRNMAELFTKIANKNIQLTVYGTKHNQDHMKKYFSGHKNVHFKCTIPHDDIIKELSKYDYGLCYFNMDYSDAEYIEISQPNKFFDYFYSRLPIICNNTHAFADFINENKVGFTVNNIDEISVKNMRKKHYFNQSTIMLYNEYINKFHKTLLTEDCAMNAGYYKYMYVSPSIKFFKEMTKKKYNLMDYEPAKHLNEPTLFYGLYNMNDLKLLIAHKGKKKLLFGGSDARYNTFTQNYRLLIRHNIEIVCQSAHLYKKLNKIRYPKYLSTLRPFTPAQIFDFYEPNNVKGNNVYIYTSKKNPEVYGNDIYIPVMEKLKGKFNFIVCEAGTTNDIKSVYKKCFIGVRLTRFDGLGCTNIELGLLGIKSITNNLSPNCLSWKTVDDVVNHIIRESATIGKKNPQLAEKTLEFISNEYDMLKV